MKRKTSDMKNTKGFTLIELVITLAVMAILVSWGFPSLQESIKNNRMAAQNNEMMAILKYARSEAIRRNTDVTVNISAITGGWTAFVDDPANEADVANCAFGQLRCASAGNVTLTGVPGSPLVFNNRGYVKEASGATFGQQIDLFLEHENCRGASQRRHIRVAPTGQVTSETLSCS